QRILSTDFTADVAQPTPNQVESLFEPFVVKGVQGRYGKRLYIFTAGHGFGDPGNMGKTALYAANARKMFPWHIAVTDYAEWLRCHAVFDEIVLIMDCCRTINSYHEIRKPQYITSRGNPDADRVRYFYAFAVGRGRVAREKEFADGRSSGIFTKAMLDALKITKPEQGQVTGQLLKNHIHNSINRFAGQVQIDPPEIRLDSNRDIVFLNRKQAGSTQLKITLTPYTGEEVLVLFDGSFQEIRQEKATKASMTLELEPGLYKIAVKNTNRQNIFEVPSHEQITV
ncbi:MAG: hypothetical protein D3923_10065, partial [Candidatus Electrothrix sp. AR3]|nr:hypothetical protein [Candidatus Electrothrix sp. AR3]